MKNKIMLLFVLAPLSQAISATDSSNEVNLLREQIKLLNQRLDNLEKQPKDENEHKWIVTKQVTKKPAKKSIFDRLSFKADFRERFEIIDQAGKASRERNRVRLRAALSMEVNENVSFTLGMATGADDPVSTNQTLGGAFSTKDIRLDLAFFNYKFSNNLQLSGGKMKNPFYKPGKNAVFWDSDLNPEGFALKFSNDFLQGNLVGFSVEERKSASDSFLLGSQIMHGFKISESSKLMAGIGYYDYSNLKGSKPLFNGKPKGNSIDANGNFVTDFNIVEAFLEYKVKLAGQPFSAYGNYFQNTTANDLDTAYTIGLKYGKVRGAGTWDIGLAYLDIEADAVLGLFNDSDFAGGNTDSKGISFKAGYGLTKNIALSLTYINSEFGQSQAAQTDYERLQLDFKLKFK